MRYASGARGVLVASQVSPGNYNRLSLKVYGDKAGLEWYAHEPEYLRFCEFGKPHVILTRGGAGVGGEAARVSRMPAEHPEGYVEGFGNLYRDAIALISARRRGEMIGFRACGARAVSRRRSAWNALHRGIGRQPRSGRCLDTDRDANCRTASQKPGVRLTARSEDQARKTFEQGEDNEELDENGPGGDRRHLARYRRLRAGLHDRRVEHRAGQWLA